MFSEAGFSIRRNQMIKEGRNGKNIGGHCGWISSSFSLGYGYRKRPGPPKKTSELLSQGEKIFGQICAPCYGSKGDGKGPAGAVLKPPPTDFQKPLKEWPNTKGELNRVFEVISKGIPNSAMVPWIQYSEKERWALVYVVMGFAKKK